MSQREEKDPLLRWGHEAAVLIFALTVLIALAMVIVSVVQGRQIEASARSALIVLVIGMAIGFGIVVLRKRHERAARPAWMGSTMEWNDEIPAKVPSEGSDNPG